MPHRSLVVALALLAAPGLRAQSLAAPLGHTEPVAAVQQRRAEKSPALAAALSWLVFPGLGSYYAGNSQHGTRHVLVAAGSLVGTVALLATCDSDGFCDFDHDGARLTVTVALVATYVGNVVWSVITAITDAEQFNQSLASGPMSLSPAIVALRPPTGALGGPSIGVRVVRVAF